MKYRRLGRTNLNVSIVGFGGIPIVELSNVQAVRVLMRALELGINLIETGRSYRDSEGKIGYVMKKERGKCYLASKTPLRDKDGAIEHINASLRALKTDYIDIYQLHQVEHQEEFDQIMGPKGALEALKQAQEQGKIRYIGITGHSAAILANAIRTGEFDTVQVLFNVVEQEAAGELFPLARELDVGVMVMKPFGGGVFLDKEGKLSVVLNQESANIVQTLLRFALSYDVSTALAGVKTIEEVEQDAAVGVEFEPFSNSEINNLISSVNALRPDKNFCHRCGYCLPCPQGISIPLVLRLNEYYSKYNLKNWATEIYKHLPARANDCVECGTCEERCPYELPISNILKQAQARFAGG